MTTPYEQAVGRIAQTPELEPYREAILYDWHEGDDHYVWAATCPIAELLDWAQAVEADKPEPSCEGSIEDTSPQEELER